jgi:mannose-1-phosphate guanylyltransferase
MKAIVLCAGLGTRLRPLTDVTPKPAMPFLGVPLFRFALSLLQRGGVSEVGINTFHLPETMAQVAARECQRFRLPLTVSNEWEQVRGTGGGIAGLYSLVEGDTFVVLNGDVLCDVDLAEAVAAHRRSGAAATLVLMPMPLGETFNTVEIDGGFRVRRIAGKGKVFDSAKLSGSHFTGMHIISPQVSDFGLRYVRHAPPVFDIVHDVYVDMLHRGEPVHGHLVVPKFWYDLGTPARFLSAHVDLLGHRQLLSSFSDVVPAGFLGADAPRSDERPGVQVAMPAFVDATAEVGVKSVIGPNVFVGAGARIGTGCSLSDCVVLNDSVVPDGTKASRCIFDAAGHQVRV